MPTPKEKPTSLRAAIGTGALMAVSAVGAGLMLLATHRGAGLSPDSGTYIACARNLLAGRGFVLGEGVPMTHFPPLFPALLAALGLAGLDPLQGARFLNVLLFAALIWMTGRIVRSHTDSPSLALVTAFIVLLGPPTFRVHSMAWSEPIFLLTTVLALHLLAVHLEHPSLRMLACAALVTSAAFLARYAGLAVVAAGCAALLLPTRRVVLRRRLGELFFFLGLSCALPACWILRNLLLAHSAVDRSIAWHPPGGDKIRQGVWTFVRWFLPRDMPILWGFILLSVLSLAAAVALFVASGSAGNHDSSRRSPLPRVLAIFCCAYLGLVIGAISILDAQTPLDDRILSPIYLAGVMALLICAPDLPRAFGRHERTVSFVLVAACILLFGMHARRLWWSVPFQYRHGEGYADIRWQTSDLLREIPRLPEETEIYSNAPDAIYLVMNRQAREIPRKLSPHTMRRNKDYSLEMKELQDALRRRGAVIVYFSIVGTRGFLPSASELERELALKAVCRSIEGAIYAARPGGEEQKGVND